MTFNYFDAKVPGNESIDTECEELLSKCDKTILRVGQSIEKAQFRKGLSLAMTLASDANKFLEERKPWQSNKTDKDKTAATLWTALSVINCLRVVMEPYLPFSSIKLRRMLGFSDDKTSNWTWNQNDVIPGSSIEKPDPLFKKLDDVVIETEDAKLRA
jgi:methionyl-tRNA synthetase